MRGKLTMFFFPSVPTKENDSMPVLVVYGRTKGQSHRSLGRENDLGSHVFQHFPTARTRPGLNPLLTILQRTGEWPSRSPLALNPRSTY